MNEAPASGAGRSAARCARIFFNFSDAAGQFARASEARCYANRAHRSPELPPRPVVQLMIYDHLWPEPVNRVPPYSHVPDSRRFPVGTTHAWGVRTVFGYPGDGINGLLGALHRANGKIGFIQVRHEEMAAFMASAYAKFTGELGVCIATSAPARRT